MRAVSSAGAAVLLALSAGPLWAAEKEVEAELKAVVVANMEAAEKKDLEGIKATVHTQSPAYLGTVDAMRKLFEHYDLRYELVSLRYVGSDGDYAFAHGSQKTKKVQGPAFKDNTVDSVYVFRKEEGKWKLWQQAVLEVKYAE